MMSKVIPHAVSERAARPVYLLVDRLFTKYRYDGKSEFSSLEEMSEREMGREETAVSMIPALAFFTIPAHISAFHSESTALWLSAVGLVVGLWTVLALGELGRVRISKAGEAA